MVDGPVFPSGSTGFLISDHCETRRFASIRGDDFPSLPANIVRPSGEYAIDSPCFRSPRSTTTGFCSISRRNFRAVWQCVFIGGEIIADDHSAICRDIAAGQKAVRNSGNGYVRDLRRGDDRGRVERGLNL